MNNLKPYEIIILAAGVLMLIFSFLEWISFGDEGRSAWGSGLLPLATLAPIFGVVMAGVVAARAFGNANLPARVLGFTWPQIHLVLAMYALLIMIHYLLVEKGGADTGIGLIVNLLGAIGLVVGAFMMLQAEGHGVGPAAGGPAAGPGPAPGTPPQSF